MVLCYFRKDLIKNVELKLNDENLKVFVNLEKFPFEDYPKNNKIVRFFTF